MFVIFCVLFSDQGKVSGEFELSEFELTEKKIPDKWGEIQGKLDLVRVIGALLYTHLVHVITGLPSSRYECVPHKRVGVPLQMTVDTLYVNHGIDLNGFVRLLLCDPRHFLHRSKGSTEKKKKNTARRSEPPAVLFFCAAFTSYYEESDRGHTITAKKIHLITVFIRISAQPRVSAHLKSEHPS